MKEQIILSYSFSNHPKVDHFKSKKIKSLPDVTRYRSPALKFYGLRLGFDAVGDFVDVVGHRRQRQQRGGRSNRTRI